MKISVWRGTAKLSISRDCGGSRRIHGSVKADLNGVQIRLQDVSAPLSSREAKGVYDQRRVARREAPFYAALRTGKTRVRRWLDNRNRPESKYPSGANGQVGGNINNATHDARQFCRKAAVPPVRRTISRYANQKIRGDGG